MTSLTLSDLDEVTVRKLGIRARQHRHSIEEEARSLLHKALEADAVSPLSPAERVRRAREISAMAPPQVTDSLDFLREERDL